MVGTDEFPSNGLLLPLVSSPVLFLLDDGILGVSFGNTLIVTVTVIIYVSASAILWYEELPRASIGYLLLVVSLGVLVAIGLKNSPVAIVAFFGCALGGGGLAVYEAIVQVENRSRDEKTSHI
jgi:hypothetical protein